MPTMSRSSGGSQGYGPRGKSSQGSQMSTRSSSAPSVGQMRSPGYRGRPSIAFDRATPERRPGTEIPGYSGHIPGSAENVLGLTFKRQNDYTGTQLRSCADLHGTSSPGGYKGGYPPYHYDVRPQTARSATSGASGFSGSRSGVEGPPRDGDVRTLSETGMLPPRGSMTERSGSVYSGASGGSYASGGGSRYSGGDSRASGSRMSSRSGAGGGYRRDMSGSGAPSSWADLRAGAGPSGRRPSSAFERAAPQRRAGTDIPGYAGHIPGSAENAFGQTFRAQNDRLGNEYRDERRMNYR